MSINANVAGVAASGAVGKPYFSPILVGTSVLLAAPSAKAALTVTDSPSAIQKPSLPSPIVRAALSISGSRVVSGHPVMIFAIPQVVNLTYPGSLAYRGTPMNNYPVNRTNFRLVRGVRNEIVFFVRDIDRKPVALTGGDRLTIIIVDQSDTLRMTRDLTLMDQAKGIYQFATLPGEMDTWPTGPLRWSVAHTQATGTVLLWTDQSYSPYSSLVLSEAPVPGPAPTLTFIWSDFTLLDDWYYTVPLIAAAQDGYANAMQTCVGNFAGFTGTVRVDGSLDPQYADWSEVLSRDYADFTGTGALDVPGDFLWLRVAVSPIAGSLTRLRYRSGVHTI